MHYNVAVVGATGLVGRTILQVMAERNFPLAKLLPLASPRSAGQVVEYKGEHYPVAVLNENSFANQDLDIALFSAGGSISKVYCPIAKRQGVTAIDNSSAWRLTPEVPLIVPEVNPQALAGQDGIIANPNCSTIQGVIPLKALQDAFGLRRVIYTTYQSVSGSGHRGLAALEAGLAGNPQQDYPIADNCIPHIGDFLASGYTEEEEKMIVETRKILDDWELPVTATTVRVPVRHCHCVAISVEVGCSFAMAEVFSVLESAPGIILQDDPSQALYPLPQTVVGSDAVWVGRVRRDESTAHGLHLWTVADNIRKGAATNAVQIAELLVTKKAPRT